MCDVMPIIIYICVICEDRWICASRRCDMHCLVFIQLMAGVSGELDYYHKICVVAAALEIYKLKQVSRIMQMGWRREIE